MKKILTILTILILACSCKTIKQIEYRNVYVRDTIYQNHIQYDSIYVKETEKTRSDTVYLTRETFKYKFKTDTLIYYKDSIRTEYVTQIQEVQKPIPSVYKWSLAILILLIIGTIGYAGVKLYLKFRI